MIDEGNKVQEFVTHMEKIFLMHPIWEGKSCEVSEQAVEVSGHTCLKK